jgi:sugar-specific transcriptional regulator TrmB
VSSISRDDYIKALVGLGLSGPQARPYFALLELGTSTVRQLAIISKLDRPDTYRATIDLLQLGLIEKVIANPAKYKPLAFADAVNILLQRKLAENAEFLANLDKLIKGFEGKCRDIALQDENQFVLVPVGEATEIKVIRLFQSAQKTVLVIVPRKRLFHWLLTNYNEIVMALERHLTVKIITEAPDKSGIPSKIQELTKSNHFVIKYLKKPPALWFRIYDCKDLLLNTSSKFEKKETSAVWSNNTCLVELAEAYFYSVWETAGK